MKSAPTSCYSPLIHTETPKKPSGTPDQECNTIQTIAEKALPTPAEGGEIPPHKTIPFRLTKNLEAAREAQNAEKDKNFRLREGELPKKLWQKPFNGRSATIGPYTAGVASTEGLRNSMEDADIAIEFSAKFNGKEERTFQLFGIFDGHGGEKVSAWVRDNIQSVMTQVLEDCARDGNLTDEAMWNALKTCFKELDAQLPTDFERQGTTATVALIVDEKQLWVANVGDSRTILVEDNQAIQLSQDAKPSIERFSKKIEKLGGVVILGRVNYQLSVARAIGDKGMVNLEKTQCVISPNPKITKYDLNKTSQPHYLVLACDGLWDIASTEQIKDAIIQMHREGKKPEAMAKRLMASATYSSDNISVIVVRL